MSEWWKHNNSIPLNDLFKNDNFKIILEFYLFNCPVVINKKKVCIASKTTLESKGWTFGNANSLLAAMKRALGKCYQYGCVALGDIENELYELKNINQFNFDREIIIFSKDNNLSKTSAIFYCIRNAFAHGSFSVVNHNSHRIYIFENKNKGQIKCRFVLNEVTLLEWIELYNSKLSYVKKFGKEVKYE